MKDGQFQVYTGNGKGKTTAAIGLTVRAVGAGLRVYFCQFIKSVEYSELKLLRQMKNVTCEQFGTEKGCMICREPDAGDYAAAKNGMDKLKRAVMSESYDLVIADEINVAYYLGLVTDEEMLEVIEARPPSVELVFTGRSAGAVILEKADLVTDMQEVRHYFAEKGLIGRYGIDCGWVPESGGENTRT